MQKRGKVIFSILLAIIIVAFVFTIGAGPGLVESDRRNLERNFYGVDLNSSSDMQMLRDSTLISQYTNRASTQNPQQFEQEMLMRQVFLYLANEFGIPGPNEQGLQEYLKTKAAFMGQTGEFDASALQSFVDTLEGGGSFSQAFVLQVLRDDYRIDQIVQLLEGPGFANEAEVLNLLKQQQTIWDIQYAEFEFDSFNPQISITDEELQEYYANQSFRYEIPEEFTISYVEFEPQNVQTEIPQPDEETLQTFYLSNRSLFADAEAALYPEPETTENEEGETEEAPEPAPTLTPLQMFVELKDDVLEAYMDEQRGYFAAVEANDFTAYLYEREIAYQGDGFNELLAEFGVNLKYVPPFNINRETQLIGVVPAMLFQRVMDLTATRYYTDVVPKEDQSAYYVAFLESKTEPRIPELSEVTAEVTADLRLQKRRDAFVETGTQLSETFREAIEAGTPLEEVDTDYTISWESYEPFTVAERPENITPSLMRDAESLQTGEISEMLTAGNTGFWIYMKDRTTPEIDATSEDFTENKSAIEDYSSFARMQTLMTDMISRQLPAAQTP